MKIIVALIMSSLLSFSLFGNELNFTVNTDLEISSESAYLIEVNSGTVLYEKNSETKLKPASVTKVMTLLLTFDEIKAERLALDDIVTISSHAASMGGSQCFFEAGEQQTVNSIIKCIEVSSGNDAAVAMGEHISGSEAEFVKKMNERAVSLGMLNTNFVNACGLDDDNHYTSAKDIGIMSRELIYNHPEIFNYSTIWMDHIIHKTSKGESRFDLANTNKFLRQYTGANGLKTGYTSQAGYCMAGSATRNGVTLVAVIMGADTKEIRNSEISMMLDYGFSKCEIYNDTNVLSDINEIKVINGVNDTVIPYDIKEHNITLINNTSDQVQKKVVLYKEIKAPIIEGDTLGTIQYSIDGKLIDEVYIYSSENVPQKTYYYTIRDLLNKIFVIE